MDLQFSELPLYNPGVLKTRLPVNVFAELTSDLQRQVDAKPETYNHGLAGHIETELQYIVNGSFKNCIDQTYLEYRKRYNHYTSNEYNLDNNAWVNFQKKNEYNPLHFHYQEISWVTWVSIPYDLAEEDAMANVKEANTKAASRFQFVYNLLDSGIHTHEINIDKSWEGVLIMFPSYLKHQVYSFQTSDQHRISVSGNISITK